MNEDQSIQNHILFLGNRRDVHRLYQAMDVFVLPSRYEGLPVVGIEAQACDLPCCFSNSMTEETKYMSSVEFMSISKEPSEWAKRIMGWKNRLRKVEKKDDKFNIAQQAIKLQLYYKSIM